MKKYLYDLISVTGLIIWVGVNWYFGWNEEAASAGEKFIDSLAQALMLYGFFNSVVRGVKTEVTVNYVNNIEKINDIVNKVDKLVTEKEREDEQKADTEKFIENIIFPQLEEVEKRLGSGQFLSYFPAENQKKRTPKKAKKVAKKKNK